MNAVGPAMPSIGTETYIFKKGVEGYIIVHNWQTIRELTEKQKEQGYGTQYDFHGEEFAYTNKDEALAKLSELIG